MMMMMMMMMMIMMMMMMMMTIKMTIIEIMQKKISENMNFLIETPLLGFISRDSSNFFFSQILDPGRISGEKQNANQNHSIINESNISSTSNLSQSMTHITSPTQFNNNNNNNGFIQFSPTSLVCDKVLCEYVTYRNSSPSSLQDVCHMDLV